jgi:phosphoribosylglycinamide formyltransferase-1
LVQEHRVYPLAVRWLAENRLRLLDGHVRFDVVQDASGTLIAPLAR